MPAVYLTNVTGDGLSPETGFRPAIAAGVPCVVLMLDPVRGRACIVSTSTSLSGAGITKLLEGTTYNAMWTSARGTGPNNPTRTQINGWLTAAQLATVPANLTTWEDVIQFVVRQVNPAADLFTATVG